MFIQTEATPNPATLKFLPGQTVLETGTLDLREPGGEVTASSADKLALNVVIVLGALILAAGLGVLALWMTSGNPVSRAAAIWTRKPAACASRGLYTSSS